jgi:hypothetical protein
VKTAYQARCLFGGVRLRARLWPGQGLDARSSNNMGETMNRINTTSLGLTVLAGIAALAAACSSGGDDDGNDASDGGKASGGNSATAGNATSGGNGNAAGNASTAGNANGGSTTAGTGTGGAGGTKAPSVCDDVTFALPVGEAYIDAFEDEVRLGGWYAFSDTTPADTPAKPERVEGGALETGYAGHLSVSGIKSSKTDGGYGAGFGFGLVDPAKGKCVDITAFKGLSFWAKGTAGADNTLKFQIVAPATQPTDSKPAGDCKPGTACAFAHPAKTIKLTPEWQQYDVKFSELAPAAAFTGIVMGFNMITDGPAYDVSFDEVTFYTDTAPTGPVAPATGEGGAGNQ